MTREGQGHIPQSLLHHPDVGGGAQSILPSPVHPSLLVQEIPREWDHCDLSAQPLEKARRNCSGSPVQSPVPFPMLPPPPGLGNLREGLGSPGGSRGSTCDEVAEFSIEAHVIVCAVQPDHPEISRHVLRHRHIVHSREEGGCFIIHIQHCGQKGTQG